MKPTWIIAILLAIGIVIGLGYYSAGLIGSKVLNASEFSNIQKSGLYVPGDIVKVSGIITQTDINSVDGVYCTLDNQRYANFIIGDNTFQVGQSVTFTVGFINAQEGGSAPYVISWM